MTLDEAIEERLKAIKVQEKLYEESYSDESKEIIKSATDNDRQLAEWLTELKEAKRLLKAAIEDFAKLDRENTMNKNCMMPEMDCADCPLNWDSVDDRIEPCHSWRYTNEALKLIWR